VKLLEGTARDEPGGKRAYAVILLVACLGLRNSDVCNLKFENIDFDHKEISFVQVKTKKPNTLPLLPEVESALVDYIQNERPLSDVPFIFINRRMLPYRAMSTSIIKHRLEKLFINTGIRTALCPWINRSRIFASNTSKCFFLTPLQKIIFSTAKTVLAI